MGITKLCRQLQHTHTFTHTHTHRHTLTHTHMDKQTNRQTFPEKQTNAQIKSLTPMFFSSDSKINLVLHSKFIQIQIKCKSNIK